jgi:hypothetical protein
MVIVRYEGDLRFISFLVMRQRRCVGLRSLHLLLFSSFVDLLPERPPLQLLEVRKIAPRSVAKIDDDSRVLER